MAVCPSIELEAAVRCMDCCASEVVDLELCFRIEGWRLGAVGPSLHGCRLTS